MPTRPPATRYAASFDDVAALLADLGEPAYRARQLWDGLYGQRRSLDDITTLPAALRARIAEALPEALTPVVVRTADDGRTVKWLWSCHDGAEVETVLMVSRDRATVCVSSQAGCAMGCSFCATGQAGFERHLDVGEIVEQVVRAAQVSPIRVSHVVYMGMGEPLANVEPVLASLHRLHTDLGLSARHLTVSTVGVIPGMRRLTADPLPVTLAVSVHAADDHVRDELVPLNRRYPLHDVLAEARAYHDSTGRRVTVEYALLAGVNDSTVQAERLARRLQGLGMHVNLIPYNPTPGLRAIASSAEVAERFAGVLRRAGITATIRRTRGVDIDAACGQLRRRVRDGEADPVALSPTRGGRPSP